jgi:hypothetical protein
VQKSVLLDVVVAESTSVFEPARKKSVRVPNSASERDQGLLLPGENEALLIRRYTFAVLDSLFDLFDLFAATKECSVVFSDGSDPRRQQRTVQERSPSNSICTIVRVPGSTRRVRFVVSRYPKSWKFAASKRKMERVAVSQVLHLQYVVRIFNARSCRFESTRA